MASLRALDTGGHELILRLPKTPSCLRVSRGAESTRNIVTLTEETVERLGARAQMTRSQILKGFHQLLYKLASNS